MTTLMLALSLLSPNAHAGWEHRVSLSSGATASVGLKTALPVYGADGALTWTALHGRHGVRVELRDMVATSEGLPANLPGLGLSWTASWGQGTWRAYHALGAGGYLNDVLPVLPIVHLEGGVERVGERLVLQAGPQALALPPFFVGGGLRLTVGLRF